MEDPNIAHDVMDKFSTFKIIVVFELDFVKIVKMSKFLNNKACNMSMNLSYHKSLSHVHWIWISYDRPTLDLDGSMRHNEKYKISYLFSFQEVILVLEIYLRSFLILFFVTI